MIYDNKLKILKSFSLILICVVLLSNFSFTSYAGKNQKDEENIGFNTGPSYKSVVPLSKTIFVNYDEESLVDDYSFLACIPASVFNYDDQLYSNPLLFHYNPPNNYDKTRLTLDPTQGIEYFMEDWINYNNGSLDQILGVNTPTKELKKWSAKDYKIIYNDNEFDNAKEIALHEWSFSDSAVITPTVTEYEKKTKNVKNTITENFPKNKIKKLPTIEVKDVNFFQPIYNQFHVDDKYKHIHADIWWDSIFINDKIMISSSNPEGNPDIQLYFNQNSTWIQSESSCKNIFGPLGHKYTNSYVHKPGMWRIGIVDMLTYDKFIRFQGNPIKIFTSKEFNYYADITLFPGLNNIKIPEKLDLKCEDVFFRLKWFDGSVDLGFSVIGPSGEVIYTALDQDNDNLIEIKLESLAKLTQDECYSISVFSTSGVTKDIEFKIEYSWKQELENDNQDFLSSASEGAILASNLNAPLLFTKPTSLHTSTKEAFLKLGVKNIYIVDIGNHLSEKVIKELKEIAKVKKRYTTLRQVYNEIRRYSGENDIIFSTINPWIYWDYNSLEPIGKEEAGFFIGPASYIAAHHGSPLILIENHPRLSSAAIYHNELWRRFSTNPEFHRPSTAEMILTGEKIYDFLDDYDFNQESKETIITVAGQYNIGSSWDRIFTGQAYSGRFIGSPVDTSYWISRNIFYPLLIYENPTLKNPVSLVNGSISTRNTGFKIGKLLNILDEPLITIDINEIEELRESEDEFLKNSTLCSFISYTHRFNERASIYFNRKYVGADGLTPGFDQTEEYIDFDSMKNYIKDRGSVYPDMTESEVIPFYLYKGGYNCSFSTSFESVINNLNNGTILWFHSSHGSKNEGGSIYFWNPENESFIQDNLILSKLIGYQKKIIDKKNQRLIKSLSNLSGIGFYFKIYYKGFEPAAGVFEERNPWRGYDWYRGSTIEPDTMSIDIKGIIPFTNKKSIFMPISGADYVATSKPIKEFLNKIIPLFNPFDLDDLHDGIIGSNVHSKLSYKEYSAVEIEEHLNNLHSTGVISTMCSGAATYFHLMMIRHGSAFQILNPWDTSIYGSIWQQSIPRNIVLGNTIGEALSTGISHVGNIYLGKNNRNRNDYQLWWDNTQNIVCYGDPDLRVIVPNQDFSANNYWNKPIVLQLSNDKCYGGHTPLGANIYPHKMQPKSSMLRYLLLFALVVIFVFLEVLFLFSRKKKK